MKFKHNECIFSFERNKVQLTYDIHRNKMEKPSMECHYSIIFTLIVHHDNYMYDDDDNADTNNARKTRTCYNFFTSSFSALSHL